MSHEFILPKPRVRNSLGEVLEEHSPGAIPETLPFSNVQEYMKTRSLAYLYEISNSTPSPVIRKAQESFGLAESVTYSSDIRILVQWELFRRRLGQLCEIEMFRGKFEAEARRVRILQEKRISELNASSDTDKAKDRV